MDFTIQHQKIAQAIAILREQDVPAWMTFVRETKHNADPALGLIVNMDMTWHSAFIVTATGQKIAIAGRYDCPPLVSMGVWDQVISYDQSIEPVLLKVFADLNVTQVAVNYSESDSAADGLSHGMFTTLERYFKDKVTLISAEDVLNALRGRKSDGEIERIKGAIRITEDIFLSLFEVLHVGKSEREIAAFIHAKMAEAGVTESFSTIVNCGPDSPIGHTKPSDQYVIQPGQLVHIDMGVVARDYVSDLQRIWYIQGRNELDVPAPVQRAFRAVRGAILAGGEVLKPGIEGWVADAAARKFLVSAGYPEYQHALGHHIGRTVHDGSTLLGPKWERYGKSPMGIVEVGNCYTLELGVHVAGYGLVSLEEDVVVTPTGYEWLSNPQTDLTVILV
jgi:Xaa-Pro aminopeptidase